MNINKALAAVDVERMYQHVLKLEGQRHPLDAPEGLLEAAHYISAELQKYGLPVRVQEFQIEGCADTFLNVEGWIGDENEPCAALMNHYDTNEHTTGANDNAAAVAVALEAARILAQERDTPAVRFLSFSLEEGNPAIQSRIRTSLRESGLVDDQMRYTSYQASQALERHQTLTQATWQLGRPGRAFSEAIAAATAQMKDEVPPPILKHFENLEAIWQDMTPGPGQSSHLGAWAWVEEALRLNKRIKFGICLDEIGRVYKEEGSQTLPAELTWDMMETYKVDKAKMIGDWAFIITNEGGEKLGQAICTHCQHEDIDLPYGYFHIPMNYAQIQKELPQTIGSDYSAFWHAGIPALMLFDTAGWRKPYRGHTMADTIDRLDFDQITRICKAVIATLVDETI